MQWFKFIGLRSCIELVDSEKAIVHMQKAHLHNSLIDKLITRPCDFNVLFIDQEN